MVEETQNIDEEPPENQDEYEGSMKKYIIEEIPSVSEKNINISEKTLTINIQPESKYLPDGMIDFIQNDWVRYTEINNDETTTEVKFEIIEYNIPEEFKENSDIQTIKSIINEDEDLNVVAHRKVYDDEVFAIETVGKVVINKKVINRIQEETSYRINTIDADETINHRSKTDIILYFTKENE